MALRHQGKPIVRDGLVFCIDPANEKCLIKPIDINVIVKSDYDSSHDHYSLHSSSVNGKDRGNFNTEYDFSGEQDPTLVMFVGDTIRFDMTTYSTLNTADSGENALWIKTNSSTGTGNAVSTPAAINNGSVNNDVYWTPYNAGTYYYNSVSHSNMTGSIIVKDDPKTILDISGYGQFDAKSASMGKATVVGIASYTGVNNAIYLNGDDNYIKLPLGSTSEVGQNLFGTNWSFDMWAYLDRDQAYTSTYANYDYPQGLFTMNSESDWNGGTTSNSGVAFGWNRVWYRHTLGNGNNVQRSIYWSDSNNPSVREWHHFCMTINNGTGTVYLDGQQVAQTTDSMTTQSGDTGQRAIGITDYYGGNYRGCFQGFIGGFKHYTRTLSATEVSINYNATKGRFGI